MYPMLQKQKKKKDDSYMKDMYDVPEHLQGKFTQLTETEAGERWLAGMEEVPLPMEYKLKNIEETEAAKRRMLAPKTRETSILNIPGNFNQNFKGRHFDQARKNKRKKM